MNMLISELQGLSANPLAWVVVVILSGFALYSVIQIMKCPYTHDAGRISDDAVRAARGSEFSPGMRFGMMMAMGAVLTLLGLFMIANGIKPALALASMVCGIVIILTEPTRLQIREHRRVVAANRDSANALVEAQDRLNSSYTQMAATNILLMLGVTGALLAF